MMLNIGGIITYKILTINNSKEWLDIINSFHETDIYYHPGYLAAFCENGDGEPLLFYFENEYGRVANVFLKRDIYDDAKLEAYIKPEQYYDIATVYGYGGPIFEADDFKKLQECYLNEFEQYCKKINAITEFIRFHPVLKNHTFLEDIYNVQNIRSTVYMDLSKGEDYILPCLESNCKRNINKALSEGVSILYGRDIFLIDEFSDLYLKTMRRDNASCYYYFNEKFFYTTMKELQSNSLIFAATYDDKIIAASIILFSDKFVHYHLAGSDIKYQRLRPNNLLIYEAAKWGAREGKKVFHLGGGFSGDGDNLFRFKKSFSNKTPLSFHIGKKIFNDALHKELIDLRVENDKNFNINTTYFPKYRG